MASQTSPLDELIKITQDLETALEEDYGATGRGLHEKVSSVQQQISPQTIKRIRFIATIRNKAIHDDINVAAEEIENVRSAAEDVYRELSKKNRHRKSHNNTSSVNTIGNTLSALSKIVKFFIRSRR